MCFGVQEFPRQVRGGMIECMACIEWVAPNSDLHVWMSGVICVYVSGGKEISVVLFLGGLYCCKGWMCVGGEYRCCGV